MEHAWPILIFGPTASGKSALALSLAARYGATIVNADSMQVYRELSILTARPSQADQKRVPHFLYGCVPASQAYSAGRFVQDVGRALSQVRSEDRRAILVGGTGLYFKALLEGLSPIPEIPADVRTHWRGEAERCGALALHGILVVRDPDMAARLRPTDTQRIVRALEVLDASGKSLSHWRSQPGRPVIDPARAVKIALLPPRKSVQARAERRFDEMMAVGALHEALELGRLSLDPSLPAMRALGVAPLIAAGRGELNLAEAVFQAKADTRQYIKRQETWARSNMIAWKSVFEEYSESIESQTITFIDSMR